jgi:hypothetical protein
MEMYYVPEKPPLAGPIRTGEDARRHMAAFDEYKQRLPLDRKGVEFYLTLTRETVRSLQNLTVLRELGPVGGSESDEDEEELEDEEKNEQDETPLEPAALTRSLSTPGRRLERMRAALSEESLRKELRIQFGPKSIQDSLVILNKIQMSDRPFAFMGNGSDYNEEWRTQLKWIGAKKSASNPDSVRPADRSLMKLFLAGVKPATFREQLTEEYYSTLSSFV